MTKEQAKNKMSTGKKIAGIIGVTAAASLAAYLAYDKKGTKQKIDKAKNWMHQAKKDLMVKIKTLKEVDKEIYEKTVDQIIQKYHQIVNVSAPEVKKTVKELKSYWNTIKSYVPTKQSTKSKKPAGKSAKKPAAKSAKKPAGKSGAKK